MALIKTPFHDAVGPESVPRRGSKSGVYDREPGVGGPDRDGGELPELYRDTSFGAPPRAAEPGTNLKNFLGG